jgi:hypothetical protein
VPPAAGGSVFGYDRCARSGALSCRFDREFPDLRRSSDARDTAHRPPILPRDQSGPVPRPAPHQAKCGIVTNRDATRDAGRVAGDEYDARRPKDDRLGIMAEDAIEIALIPGSDPFVGEYLRVYILVQLPADGLRTGEAPTRASSMSPPFLRRAIRSSRRSFRVGGSECSASSCRRAGVTGLTGASRRSTIRASPSPLSRASEVAPNISVPGITLDPARVRTDRTVRGLPAAARDLIGKAETAFVASSTPLQDGLAGSADVSHRGGKPGFVGITVVSTMS